MDAKKLAVFTFALFLSSGELWAQFKKYKSNTQFRGNDQAPATVIVEKAQDPNQESNAPTAPDQPQTLNTSAKDVFGRGTGISNVKNVKKDDKYVNLNPETAFGPEVVESFDFPNVSLIDLTKHMQKLTGINLILDKDLKGKITIMAPTAITVGDAWKAYLTALEINGYTLVQSGAFYKIVNTRDIRYTPTKIYTGNYTPDTDNYVMRIIPLKNIDSTEVTRSFRPFMSRYGRIIDIKQTNTIIVQDTGANINRLVRLIRFVDVPGHEETLQIIKVQFSSAQEIAKLLDQILKGGSASKFRGSKSPTGASNDNISKIIAEPRTNSIIAMANAEGAKQLRSLINKLDVRSASQNSGRINVYYLNHGDAETLSKTLSTLVSGSQAGGAAARRGSRFTRTDEDPGLFNDDVKITADKDNNALVITASPTDYLTIKDVIAKLDIPRDQVYVEGLMMETQVSRNSAFGISILGAYGSGNAQRAGFTEGGNDGLLNLLTGQIQNLGGLFAGIGAGRKVTIKDPQGNEQEVNSINGLITAIANNGNTNVLATPQILALDNQEAVFEVGDVIPVPERQTAANGSSTVSIKQQKVGLTLKITPQINKVTRFVKLKIDQEIGDFSNRQLPSGIASEAVATTNRKAVTTVVVRDKDTIAMGGLMRDKEFSSVNKVPLLGDIPVLGWLFKKTQKQVEKVNLLFFLTPKILSTYEKTAASTVKDLLNRRSTHLKNTVGEEDPFGPTVKGLYQKAKKQEEGPLYNQEDIQQFQSSEYEPDVPNYKDIAQKVKEKKSGQKK